MIKSIFLTCLIKYVSLILRYNKQEIVSPYPNCTTIKGKITTNIYSACGSVPKLCSTLCDPMNCSMPGFLVLHYLMEFAQILTSIESVMHPTIWSSVIPFSSCLWSFSASGSFPVSWLFESGGHSIGSSASASVLSMNI